MVNSFRLKLKNVQLIDSNDITAIKASFSVTRGISRVCVIGPISHNYFW